MKVFSFFLNIFFYGVYEVYADLKQHKVTVKANLHVDVGTLIKKLVKKGRHAELWPEKAEQKEKKQGKSKNKDKQGGQANSEGGNKEKETVTNEVSFHQDTAKSCENGSTSKNAEGCNVGKVHEGGAPCKNGGQVKEAKPEVKQTVTFVVGNQSPVAEKNGGGESEGNAGGGSGSKKNKKKGEKGNANVNFDGGEHSGDAGHACIGSHVTAYGAHGPVPMPSPASHSPPRQHHNMYEHPAYCHASPVYVTSYNTAYPSSSHSASYYTSPPPYSYMYINGGTHSSQPSDSFEMFSDENPNACSIV
ncbi:heavy metal-associated isoprenylated plant protein 36-like isoform X2 [Durio zibethinus]|uniref:Heavy metal-associated isoprenylated plant protein 36-like isoform X2 n=1 Tax=Durio zibethinus TaxID=66656 RepID=A0A6P5YU64_DURZI|nr:heavy metal-associated isoprenylated plant protein 36-like isoform X2 [Durio zibethinus]